MSPTDDQHRLPDDLREIAGVLRQERPALEPLRLDAIKLRAIAGARRPVQSKKGALVGSRLTVLLTVIFLVLGTGGALALCGSGSFGQGSGNAGYWQYRTGCPSGDYQDGQQGCCQQGGQQSYGNEQGGNKQGGDNQQGCKK